MTDRNPGHLLLTQTLWGTKMTSASPFHIHSSLSDSETSIVILSLRSEQVSESRSYQMEKMLSSTSSLLALDQPESQPES